MQAKEYLVISRLWHEGEGELKSNNFASCLTDYITSELSLRPNEKEFVIFSDGCGSQNRSSVISNALLHTAITRDITIVQTYLERGHTQMECDSVHSAVESERRNKCVYTPGGYISIIQNARKREVLASGENQVATKLPYVVKYVTHDFFNDYSGLGYYSSIRPGLKAGDPQVTDIRSLQYLPEGVIRYKLRMKDD